MNADLMSKFFPEAVNNVKEHYCPFCGKEINPATEFRDPLSLKEYSISGLCQDCQDEVFSDEDTY